MPKEISKDIVLFFLFTVQFTSLFVLSCMTQLSLEQNPKSYRKTLD